MLTFEQIVKTYLSVKMNKVLHPFFVEQNVCIVEDDMHGQFYMLKKKSRNLEIFVFS